MDESPCVLMEEMWCWQAELRNWDRFFVGQFLVVKRNGNIPTLVGMNEFSAKDLRKIPFHCSCSLCHGHCRYHLIPAIHSRKDPFNPTMTMWFRSDQRRIQEFTTIRQCGMLVSRFWWQRDLKVVEVIPVDVYMSWSIQKCAFCLKSLEDFWQFSETSKVYSTTSHQSKQCLCWTCFQRFKCGSHLFIFTSWLNHPKNFTKFSRLKTSDVQVARDFAGQIQGASKQQTYMGGMVSGLPVVFQNSQDPWEWYMYLQDFYGKWR